MGIHFPVFLGPEKIYRARQCGENSPKGSPKPGHVMNTKKGGFQRARHASKNVPFFSAILRSCAALFKHALRNVWQKTKGLLGRCKGCPQPLWGCLRHGSDCSPRPPFPGGNQMNLFNQFALKRHGPRMDLLPPTLRPFLCPPTLQPFLCFAWPEKIS